MIDVNAAMHSSFGRLKIPAAGINIRVCSSQFHGHVSMLHKGLPKHKINFITVRMYEHFCK